MDCYAKKLELIKSNSAEEIKFSETSLNVVKKSARSHKSARSNSFKSTRSKGGSKDNTTARKSERHAIKVVMPYPQKLESNTLRLLQPAEPKPKKSQKQSAKVKLFRRETQSDYLTRMTQKTNPISIQESPWTVLGSQYQATTDPQLTESLNNVPTVDMLPVLPLPSQGRRNNPNHLEQIDEESTTRLSPDVMVDEISIKVENQRSNPMADRLNTESSDHSDVDEEQYNQAINMQDS